jgi:hypothetical protein
MGSSGAVRGPACRRLPAVTDRVRWNTGPLSTAGTLGRTTRSYYVATLACSDLVLRWAAAYADEASAPPNPYTVKAAVELVPGPQAASGTLYQATFDAGTAASKTLAPGQIADSDPIPVDLAAGAGFYIRTYVSMTESTMQFPLGRRHNPSLYESDVTSADYTAHTGSWTANTSYSAGPVAITGIGPALATSLLMVGSSTFEGLGDVQDMGVPGRYGWGYVYRITAGTVPITNVAMASGQAAGFTAVKYARRSALFGPHKYAIDGYGANDVTGGRSLAQIQADKIRIWRALSRRGMLTWATTLHPSGTTSTDGYATIANQTPHANNSVRVSLNAWIRDGAPIVAGTDAPVAVGGAGIRLASPEHPLSGYLETADVIETARGSGIYIVGYTVDGTHMSSAGHAAVAATITNPFT